MENQSVGVNLLLASPGLIGELGEGAYAVNMTLLVLRESNRIC
jgi:hypothetical protein